VLRRLPDDGRRLHPTIDKGSAEANAHQARSADSADHLGQHMGDVPVLVVPYTEGLRVDGAPAMMAASVLANVLPAMWSFMLAARARGLGTAWTTVHLMQEQAVADLLGMPFATTQQVCLSPLAYTIGTGFHPADRPEAESVIHWDRW
jgi:nitroreductase